MIFTKKTHYSNKVLLLPLMFLILFFISTVLITAHPIYSKQRLYIEVNQDNTNTSMDEIKTDTSKVFKISDESTSGFNCTINKDDAEPSCRLEIWITQDRINGINLSGFESLKVYGIFDSPEANDFLRISLKNYEANVLSDEFELQYKYNLVELLPSELSKPIFVDFKRLIVPTWWLTKVRDQNVKSEVDLTNISYVELATGLHASPGNYLLSVSAIEFNRQIISKEKMYEYLLIAWTVIVITTFITLSIYLQYKIRQKNANKRVLEEINDSLSIRSEKLTLINQMDEMTNVLNRTGMEEKLKECLNKNWFPMTIVMLDIDFFKKVNDKYGHQTGDNVLISLAKILNEFKKDEESVSRFGGEEFLMIMPKRYEHETFKRLDNLRKEIEAYDMGLGYDVTVSIGASTCKSISGFKSVIEQADKALYEAKNSGRNCVKFYKDI